MAKTNPVGGTTLPSGSIPDGWPAAPLADTIASCRQHLRDKRVLLIGGFGFLGGHLIRALLAAGARVTTLDSENAAHADSQLGLIGLSDAVERQTADSANTDVVAEVVAAGRFDYVFDLGDGTTSVSDALSRLRFDQFPVMVVCRKHEPAPTAGGEPVTWVRQCNLFGPYDLDESHLIPRALRNMLRDGEAPDLYFNAVEDYRDYLYVDDAVRALLLLATTEACRGCSYDLPGVRYAATPDVLHELIEVANLLQAEARERDPESTLARLRWGQTVRIGPSDPHPGVAHQPRRDGAPLHDDSGFTPGVGFRDALARTIRYYAWYYTEVAPAPAVLEATIVGANDYTSLPVTTLGKSPQSTDEAAPVATEKPLYQTLYPRTRQDDDTTDAAPNIA